MTVPAISDASLISNSNSISHFAARKNRGRSGWSVWISSTPRTVDGRVYRVQPSRPWPVSRGEKGSQDSVGIDRCAAKRALESHQLDSTPFPVQTLDDFEKLTHHRLEKQTETSRADNGTERVADDYLCVCEQVRSKVWERWRGCLCAFCVPLLAERSDV